MISPPLAQTLLAGKPVSYTLKKSRRRRSIALTIDERGLRVNAPWEAANDAIEAMLRKHAAWVLGKLAEWQERRPPPRWWRDGEILMLLGQPLKLRLADDCRGIRLEDDLLVIAAPLRTRGADVVQEAVTAWLKQQALQCFRERVAHFQPRLEVTEPEIRLSSARTRWGSCHANGRIHLNWRLVQMPLRLVDYVVAHELAHLVEMNHSPRFWKTVARVVPDHRARRTAIRTEGHRYLLL
ncbi:MAG: M48 family metallopeptidase [Burkholderiales bacterium]